MNMSQCVRNTFMKIKDKPDYKKTYFEKALNQSKASTHSIRKIMQSLGYHFECDKGHYYVYNPYEWRVKQKFDLTVRPLLDKLLKT